MKEVDLKPSSKIKIKRDGKEYILRKPKMGEILELEKKTKELRESGGSGNEEVIMYLESLGLPRDVTLDLDSEELEQVVGVVTNSKKNG